MTGDGKSQKTEKLREKWSILIQIIQVEFDAFLNLTHKLHWYKKAGISCGARVVYIFHRLAFQSFYFVKRDWNKIDTIVTNNGYGSLIWRDFCIFHISELYDIFARRGKSNSTRFLPIFAFYPLVYNFPEKVGSCSPLFQEGFLFDFRLLYWMRLKRLSQSAWLPS